MKIVKIINNLFITILILSVTASSQDITQITFINELDNKVQATYGDALIVFKLQSGSTVALKKGKSTAVDSFTLSGYNEKDILTKGMASLMTAKYLDLDGSFLYLIFGTERYAYKACIANNIFVPGGSENDKMTGPELIELLSRISDLKGGK